MQLPDGHDSSAQINDARVAPLLSAALCLTSVGPPPVISFFLPPFPCYHVSSTHLSSLVHVALLSSHHPLISCHTSRSFPHQFLTRRRACFSRLPPHLPGCLPPWIILLSSLSVITPTSLHSFHAFPDATTPTIHHVLCAGPHVRPPDYSVVPGGSARSLPYTEMLSWPGRYQSQEAVNEAVDGG